MGAVELIVIIVLAATTIGLAALSLVYRAKNKRLIATVAQLFLDKEVLVDRIDSIILEASDEANEGFIKFLSDSRQAAFDYIEQVQVAVQRYLDAVQSQDEDMIVTARMELFSHLPESPDAVEDK